MRTRSNWLGWPQTLNYRWTSSGYEFFESVLDWDLGWQERPVSIEFLSQCPRHKKAWVLYRFKNKVEALCHRWECLEPNERTKTGRCSIRPSREWTSTIGAERRGQ
jgi:hypothetical protein